VIGLLGDDGGDFADAVVPCGLIALPPSEKGNLAAYWKRSEGVFEGVSRHSV
jgi:hypothetical protein